MKKWLIAVAEEGRLAPSFLENEAILHSPFRSLLSKSRRWLFVVGAALLMLSAFVWMVSIPALRSENDLLAQKISSLKLSLRQPMQNDDMLPWKDLASQLPRFDRLAIVTADMQSLATQNGLILTDATYKPVTRVADGHVDAIEIGARMKGGYVPLKKTLANLLASHESLALESLSAHRAGAGDAVLDIELRFTFFYRKQS